MSAIFRYNARRDPDAPVVIKVIGTDTELGNFIRQEGGPDTRTDGAAALLLLREIDGVPAPAQHTLRPVYSATAPVADVYFHANGGHDAGWSSRDWGRKHLPESAAVVYIDLSHLEICTPECVAASDFLAAWRATLNVARAAQRAASERLADDRRVVVLVNNSDGLGSSYGGHLNVLLTRTAWDDLFRQRMYPSLFFLMAYQASSIVFTGQGKVGSENGMPAVDYQLSQRADFIETLVGEQTTHTRPMVNSRDEPLCGSRSADRDDLARLHVIFYDSNLCQTATWLKVGVLQIICAMIEARAIDPALLLEQPLDALHRWSHDPDLHARATIASGDSVTAVQLQQRFLEEALRFADAGGCDGIVPEAGRILAVWSDTLEKLARADWAALEARVDWVLKRTLIERALAQRPGLGWDSAEAKHLDLLYSSLDPDDGLFWELEKRGVTDRVVSDERIAAFAQEPPADTRAWTRAMLLRRAGPNRVERVDWDSVTVRLSERGWARTVTVPLPDPLGHTRAQTEHHFEAARSLAELTERLRGHPATTAVN